MEFIFISNKGLFMTKKHQTQRKIVVWKFTTSEVIYLFATSVFMQKEKNLHLKTDVPFGFWHSQSSVLSYCVTKGDEGRFEKEELGDAWRSTVFFLCQ